MSRLYALLLVLWLLGCAQPAPQSPPQTSPEPAAASTDWPAPVGDVSLLRDNDSAESEALDVSLVLFDPGLPEDVTSHGTRGIFPVIRQAESRYLPVLLRDALVASGAWGVVRVLPEPDEGAELQVSATILHSDGQRLALQVRARDATGRTWLDAIYTDVASEGDYPVAAGDDPYADLYRRIANDLLLARRGLSATALRDARRVATLRYAASLSPEAFEGFLGRDESGRFEVLRLPAENDPMLARVERIRNKEHLFVDTVDEQYVDLLEEMRPTYNLWRQYGLEQATYIDEYYQRLSERDSAGRRGSFAAMQQTYNAFKWSKIQQQDLQELAQGFNNEVTPTVLEASGRVFRLNGSLAAQYAEWRGILRDIFALETGLPAGDDPW